MLTDQHDNYLVGVWQLHPALAQWPPCQIPPLMAAALSPVQTNNFAEWVTRSQQVPVRIEGMSKHSVPVTGS